MHLPDPKPKQTIFSLKTIPKLLFLVVVGYITSPKINGQQIHRENPPKQTVPDQGTSAKRALAMADGLFFEQAPGTADASIFWQGLIIVKGNPHALETVLFLGVASLKGSGNVQMSRGVLKEK